MLYVLLSLRFHKNLILDQFSSKNAKKPDLPIIVIGNRALLQHFLYMQLFISREMLRFRTDIVSM